MVSDLTLNDAKEQIEDVVKSFTSDYEILLAKRKLNTRLDKKVTFSIKVKPDDTKGEELYDSLQFLCITDKFFVDVQTDLFVENTVLKELYFVTAIVNINMDAL